MVTIPIKGAVISNDDKDLYDFFNYESVSPADIAQALIDAAGQDVTLEISSPGGYVDAGSEIYTDLKGYSGTVTANIVGNACSAASWIAMAADHISISPTAQMMIHRASGGSMGTADDLTSDAQALDNVDQALADVYANKTGKSSQEIYDLMSKTTWMNAKQAVANGFADEIMFDENQAPVMVNAEGDLPINPAMVNKLKTMIHSKKPDDGSKPTQIKQKSETKRQANKNLSHFLWE